MRIVNLFSGSSGNCTYIKCGGAEILIDAGGSAKKITDGLRLIGTGPENIDAVFVTHEHSDHISALRVLDRKYGIPVYISLKSALAAGVCSLVDCDRLMYRDGNFSVKIKDALVTGFSVPHDSAYCYGFTVRGDGHRAAVVTDIGKVTDSVADELCGCDVAVIEANHDPDMLKYGSYPPDLKRRILSDNGHLSNGDCGKIACRMAENGLKALMLAHLSEENNLPERALDAVRAHLCGVRPDLKIVAASSCEITELIND